MSSDSFPTLWEFLLTPRAEGPGQSASHSKHVELKEREPAEGATGEPALLCGELEGADRDFETMRCSVCDDKSQGKWLLKSTVNSGSACTGSVLLLCVLHHPNVTPPSKPRGSTQLKGVTESLCL